MNKAFFENSLGNETVDVLGFTTIEAFEEELKLLTKDVEEEQT